MDENNNKKQDEKEKLTKEEEEKIIKELEDELASFLEEERKRKLDPFVLYFNIGLHNSFSVHFLLMFLTNVFTLSAILGITNYGTIGSLSSYFIGIILLTLIETTLKILMFRYLSSLVLKSLGAINIIYLMPLFYVTILTIGKVVFNNYLELISVFAGFFLLRIFLMHYIKRISFRR